MSPTEFSRIEDKYIIKSDHYKLLKNLTELNLPNASPIADTTYTLIESIYFDDNELTSLNQYLEQVPNRSKIRIRKYAPTGIWDHSYFYLELKEKANGISEKVRIKCTPNEFGIPVSEHAHLINHSIFKDIQNLKNIKNRTTKKTQNILTYVKKFRPDPITKVVYSREAFEADGFRVTFDQNLKVYKSPFLDNQRISTLQSNNDKKNSLQRISGLINSSAVLLELKHNNNIPPWMNEFLEKNKIVKCGFSKYSYSVAKQLL